eukprot:scaffold91_cov203-Alexandrium_tamarense.AAC.19
MEEEDDIIFEYEKALVDVSGEDDIGKGVARALDPNDSSSNCFYGAKHRGKGKKLGHINFVKEMKKLVKVKV